MTVALPLTPERLFEKVFAPLYPPGADLGVLRATDANPAKNPTILEAIDETAALFAKLGPEALGDASLVLDFSDASVHRIAPLLTLETRARLMAPPKTAKGEAPSAAPPLLAHVVIHGSVYVGACIVRNHGGEWLVRSPIWESRVRLESRAGVAEISPFMFWLRSLSDVEIGRSTLLDRYRANVENVTFDPKTLDVIAAPDRRLPRLEKVRFDTLYKYLKAHLPELKTLGPDFPSPERFHELGFRWLDLVLAGEGRVLIVHGPVGPGASKTGVVLFFLTKAGFWKQHYLEWRGAPGTYRFEEDGERVRVVMGDDVHETFYWGG